RCGSTCAACRSCGTVVRQRKTAPSTHTPASSTIVAPLATRVGVISDVHGNWHALEAVLAALEAEEPDEVWCLGDLVGYGPRPNRCCRTVASRAAICLAGNHDLGVLGDEPLELFSLDAAAAAQWSQGVLEPDPRAYLKGLRPVLRR